MPPSQDITAESFKFKRPIQSIGKRKASSSGPLRKRHQPRRRTLSQQQQQLSNRSFTTTTLDLDSFEEGFNSNDVSSSERSHILKDLIVVIDRQLWEAQRLGQLVIAMGGETSNDMNKRVTHVVHAPITKTTTAATTTHATTGTKHNQQPKASRLVNQALASCVRLVSPQWVVDCYEQKKRLGESYYPYDTDPSRAQQRLGYQQEQQKIEPVEQSDHDDNPFRVNPNDYLSISSDDDDEEEEQQEVQRDDDKQLVNQNTRRRKQVDCSDGDDDVTTDDEELLQSNAQQPPPDDLSVQTNQEEEEEGGYDEEGEDGQVLLRKREKRSAAISKILQAVQESKERKQQQHRQHQQRQQQQQQQQDEITITPLLESNGSDVGYLGSEEKMQVWYDEQSVNNIDPSLIPGTSTTAATTTTTANNRPRRTTTPVRRGMAAKSKRER